MTQDETHMLIAISIVNLNFFILVLLLVCWFC
jgi:hypothetical protein